MRRPEVDIVRGEGRDDGRNQFAVGVSYLTRTTRASLEGLPGATLKETAGFVEDKTEQTRQ